MMPDFRRNLLPEEDELDDPGDDDGIDFQLPGDLWFRTPQRRKLVGASYTYGMNLPDSQSGSH